jgi:hypothetical protein
VRNSARVIVGAAWLFGAVFLLPFAAPSHAEAGVIVLHNGSVFIGRIRKEEDTTEEVTLRWPYKHKTESGRKKFEHGAAPHNIRWHRRNTEKEDFDAPTDGYWEEYEDIEKYPIDNRYLPLRERWLLKRKRQDGGEEGLIVIDDPLTKGPRLHPLPVDGGTFTIQKPEGWSSVVEDNIWIFKAKEGREGYKPRIHVFSGPAVAGQADDQMRWFEKEMKKVADKGKKKFQTKDKGSLKTRPNGFDQVLTTQTVVRGRTIVTLRKVFFRNKRTYFFSAYCHESEYLDLRSLFERSMASMRIGEDKKKKKKKKRKAKKSPEPPK